MLGFALAVSMVLSFPLQGEETQLIQESSGMFPSGDDESTVSAEINEAIQHDVNMDAVNDMGNDMGLGESLKSGATSWEKKAAAAINAMSRTELAKVQPVQDDALTAKFDMDIKQAKVAMAGPEKKVTTESKIEQEADEALKDPKSADKLRKEAAQAEMDMASGIGIITPTAFIQEGASKDTDTEDIGESDDDFEGDDEDEDDGMALMGGSDADVAKAINAQISQSVNSQLGSIPSVAEDGAALQKFEEDKMDAAKFLEEKSKAKQDKKDANEEIKKKLAEAMASLTKSQALTASAEENQEAKK